MPSVQLLVIAVLALIAYSGSFHVPFVFDDESSIVANPAIRTLHGFLSGAGYAYNPRRFIGYLSFALNYKVGGLDVTGYHIVNLTIHVASAWLVYFLARLTLRTPFFGAETRLERALPLIAALLFVLHPVQTQAVTYVVQRLASLASMFYLLSVVCYIRARLFQEEQGRLVSMATMVLFLLSLAAALLAMRTKEIAATLPLVVALYEFSFFRADAKKKLFFLAPLFLTMLVVPLGMLHSGKPLGRLLSDVSELTRESHLISRGDYLLTQFSVVTTYVRLLLLPVNQNLDYDYPVYHSLFTPRVLFSFLFLAGLAGTAIYLYYRSGRARGAVSPDGTRCGSRSPAPEFRLIAFGIGWFFITLSIESSLIPITDVIFEHRLYLPSVGAFMALTTTALLIFPKAKAGPRIALVCLVLIGLTAVSWQRNQVWADPVRLWTDVIDKSPKKIRGYNNAATALIAKGEIGEAVEKLQAALTLDPGDAGTYRNLGAAFEKQGSLDQAIRQYDLSLALQPDNAYTLYNLGVAYDKKGLTERAAGYFLKALSLKEDYAEAHNNLGVLYAKLGRPDEAMAHFTSALRHYPDFLEASNNLAFALGRSGLIDKAIGQFRYSLDISRDNAQAHFNMAQAYSEKGSVDLALAEFRAASTLDPGNAAIHNKLGGAYLKSGAVQQAMEELETAIRLQPYNAVFRNDLANARSMSGR